MSRFPILLIAALALLACDTGGGTSSTDQPTPTAPVCKNPNRDTVNQLKAPPAMTIDVTGNAEKLEAFLRVLEPFGIRELVQSGMVAVGRGSRSISDRTLRPVPVPAPPAAG